MIKKLLLAIIPCMFAMTMHAQNAGNESVVFKSFTPVERGKPSYIGPKPDLSARTQYTGRKGTATGGSRWYWPYDLTDKVYLNGALTANDYVFYIDWDSTLKQRFNDPSTGPYYGAVNWLAVAQFVDPIYSIGFNQLSAGYASSDDILVRGSTPYTVDSITFPAAYMKGITGGNQNTIDTLFLSVAPIYYDSIRSYTASDTPTLKYSKVTNYDDVTANGGVLKVMRLGPTDSLNRQLGNPGAVKWKIPLDTTWRKSKDANGNYPTRFYTLAVPGGGLNVPANMGFAISVAFKPGEAWNPGDSVQQHHYFMPITSYNSSGQHMPYFYYTYNDRSMSYLMHDAAINRFSDAVRLEMFNTDDFNHEYISLAGHVTCSVCWDLSVANGNNNLLNAQVYPNPANNELNIPVTLMTAAEVHVTLTNAMGQLVATQTLKDVTNGKATFATAHLNNGIYFYNVEAGGERKTGRVTIAH